MKPLDPFTITEAVLESMDRSPDARLRSVMGSLVRHLHDFAREVKLTEDEWWRGIRFLTDAGHITDDKRQEFILLSDVLGLSTLVMAQNNTKPTGCTEATVFGPFFVEGAPMVEHGADIANGAKGAPCFVRGRVTGLDGEPVPHALVDVWQADEEGFYDVQKPAPSLSEHRARAQLRTDADGRYHFRSIVAHEYPIPHDGPVGALLDSLGRHPWRPAHLHFMIQAQGYERLITHVFRHGGRYLDSDAVFGVRPSLIADWVRHESDDPARPPVYYTLDYDFVLNTTARSAD
ncbi:intradiol ring-cleavage dioxygenase [Variovorax sp. J22G21]|uniref:intradiol ring-cleavage dioxygenase n=1 Tax=Variovorax fucosicus TaxID=3053517 RepID=UPI0025789A74|nr:MULTISPECIES: intradiol ring-cleavage dioxygenase [unclassified Variovorax]MDM0042702.1 intradiol ring-cleavage dioxygenase [Variovorax sp. J22R193]MDM0064720.1 intradiol ring-cleavage dioxygenase [Variovorax sp. J22G21]